MNDKRTTAIETFLAAEYFAWHNAARAGDMEQAWQHLERVHIVAQSKLWLHCLSHWKMLVFALQLKDWSEVIGQIFRLLLAPIGHFTGRLPTGNTGRADISAFAHAEIPADLQAIIDPGSH